EARLPGRGARLFARKIRGPLREAQHGHARRHGAAGDDDAPGAVFHEPGHGLRQLAELRDVEVVPLRLCQYAGAELEDDAHIFHEGEQGKRKAVHHERLFTQTAERMKYVPRDEYGLSGSSWFNGPKAAFPTT